MLYVHAIAEADAQRRGIHVLFAGPTSWMYAPGGWTLERRQWQEPKAEPVCVTLDGETLASLHRERELDTAIGTATLRDGTWLASAGFSPGTAEVLTIDLHEPAPFVRLAMPGPNWTTYALWHRKVVAAAPPQTQAGEVVLSATAIDAVVIHAQHADSWQVCVMHDAAGDIGWTTIAKLQLPVREVDSSLADANAEWAVAKSRLIAGDTLDEPGFAEIADALRPLAGDNLVRPIDWSTLPDPGSPNSVSGALDPLRIALLDPIVRRALGQGYFDADPALVPGHSYQYRLTGAFPADAAGPRLGFHTVPVGMPVPAEFFLGDVHVRLGQPSRVELVPLRGVGDVVVGRRGIAVRARDDPRWLLSDLLDAAIVLDFAVPGDGVALAVADAELQADAFDADGNAVAVTQVAAADGIELTFAAPCSRLVLRGTGTWLGMREVPAPPVTSFSAVTPPVTFANAPLPASPLAIAVVSTNSAPVVPASPSPRSELGFDVTWQPALALGAGAWPPDAPAAPPLESTRFELEHAGEDGVLEPVFGSGGQAFGDRAERAPAAIAPGADVALIFPEERAPATGAGQDFTIRDQFQRDPPITPPPAGTMHTYRVRAIDEIGRPSAWTTSPPTRLEKHAPPPLPVGPPDAVDAPPGVFARVLVRGGPDLTPADAALLASNNATSAIVLRWGWTDDQRVLDPATAEFRVYAGAAGVGPVPGEITAVTPVSPGRFDIAITLGSAVPASAASGGFVPSGGEYRVLDHGAGQMINATVETRLPAADGTFAAPQIGPTLLPVSFAPSQSRPPAWDERVEVVPLTDGASYEAVLFDRLLPSATNPRPSLWVGVSAADAEPYVSDTFPGGGRPGNESPIVALRCEARYRDRPELSVAPPIGDVPVVTTARAAAAGVEHDIDLMPYLGGSGLVAGEQVVVEQVDDGQLIATLRVDGDAVLAVPPPWGPRDAAAVPLPVPNPDDRAAIVGALTGDALSLADRYVVYLAARHAFADWIFAPVARAAHALGAPMRFSLPAGAARHVARVRRVDATGHRSTGAATCAVVLRVPAGAPLAPPAFAGAQWATTPSGPRLAMQATIPDARATHLLTWVAATDPRRAALATIGSRRDLPGFGVRLRPVGGGSLTPDVLTLDPSASAHPRSVTVLQDAGAGPNFVWLAVVDGDGVPSSLAGAHRLPPRGA